MDNKPNDQTLQNSEHGTSLRQGQVLLAIHRQIKGPVGGTSQQSVFTLSGMLLTAQL